MLIILDALGQSLKDSINEGDYLALSALADWLEEQGQDSRGWRMIVKEGKKVCVQAERGHRQHKEGRKLFTWYGLLPGRSDWLHTQPQYKYKDYYHKEEYILSETVFLRLKADIKYDIAKDYDSRWEAYCDLANAYLEVLDGK